MIFSSLFSLLHISPISYGVLVFLSYNAYKELPYMQEADDTIMAQLAAKEKGLLQDVYVVYNDTEFDTGYKYGYEKQNKL